jgi:hypothetical protein
MSADTYEVDRESFDTAMKDIRWALTVCFQCFGEVERSINDLAMIRDFGNLSPELAEKIRAATPKHPTGSQDTVSDIADAFAWMEILRRAVEAPAKPA